MGRPNDRKVVTEGTERVSESKGAYFCKEELDINVEDICKTWVVNHERSNQ